MQKHGKYLKGYFPMRRPQNSRRPTAKQGSYKSRSLVLAYPLFTFGRGGGEQRLNPILPKQIKSALGPEREILIVQKEKEIEELHKSIREDEEIANNENEQPSVRERAREKIA